MITLGIIGVVAALTLPALISNYQKHVYVNQLKKSVSVLSQGFTTMMGQDGVTELKDTDAFSGMARSSCTQSTILTDKCLSMKDGLERVFSNIKFTPCDGSQVKYLNGNNASSKSANSTCIEFPDGSEIYNYTSYKTRRGNIAHPTGGYVSTMYVDVNGPKNPNTIGRDIFYLYMGNNGTIYAVGSQAYSEMAASDSNREYWRTTTINSLKCDTSSMGLACAGRVLEEDAMNY